MPAAIVARELDLRVIETACLASYRDKDKGKVEVMKPATMAADGTGWLIIDDLVDTGDTARELRRMMPNAHFATVQNTFCRTRTHSR